jgi:type I site-specific restriction-modification system R (restriction) subunit
MDLSDAYDGATVPIYYESRIAKLGLNIATLPRLDQEFDEITEGEEQTSREKLKSKWAALEALVGDPKRIRMIAADLVEHFEKRLESMDGKAIVVCMRSMRSPVASCTGLTGSRQCRIRGDCWRCCRLRGSTFWSRRRVRNDLCRS